MKKVIVLLGSDHAGYSIKELIKKILHSSYIEYKDLSEKYKEGDDYPDVAFKLSNEVAKKKEIGILVCGSGAGMTIAANKVKGIRAAEAYNEEMAKLMRKHNNSNVLVLGAWEVKPENVRKIVLAWLNTKFSGEKRHVRRINKITKYEGKR